MLVTIAGGSGTGKSYLSNKVRTYIEDTFGLSIGILSLDNYYHNINEKNFCNYDHPGAFDFELLHYDLSRFVDNGELIIREYSYQTKETRLISIETSYDMVILEGLYAFYDKKIREQSILNVYLDIDINIAITRRIHRDERERGISEEENRIMINEFVIKMYEKYVSKQYKYADIVVNDSGLNPAIFIPDDLIAT